MISTHYNRKTQGGNIIQKRRETMSAKMRNYVARLLQVFFFRQGPDCKSEQFILSEGLDKYDNAR